MTATVQQKPLQMIVNSAVRFLKTLMVQSINLNDILVSERNNAWEFANQIDVLLKAQTQIKNAGFRTRKIPYKLLVSLLNKCRYEEEETMRQKWAYLLANTARENSFIDSSIYIYILSQFSLTDMEVFDTIYKIGTNEFEMTGTLSKISLSGFTNNDFNNIENLYRLRLISESQKKGVNKVVSLTKLGISFMKSIS